MKLLPAPRARQSHTQSPAQMLRQTKVPTLIFGNAREVDQHVALVVESLIRENNSAGLRTVLGLPTGSTPIGVYRELIRLHREESLDLSNVVTFNLDEYWPMPKDSIHSYNRFMRETFFDHVNIPAENIHIPDGTIPLRDVDAFCEAYEHAIEKAGGIDLQILGIGRTGHIGFNEPGSPRDSRTRIVTLDPVTRQDAASDFYGEENVPQQAITMGVGTILSARKIIIIALGEHKSPIVRRALEEPQSEEVTASFLQTHRNVTFAVDQASASELTAIRTPWLVGPVRWTPPMEKRAVIWLSRKVKKPLLKLEARDFVSNRLHDLIARMRPDRSHPPAGLRRIVDRHLHAARRSGAAANHRLQPASGRRRDLDGRYVATLADQGHDVHIAYMTSGNIAVFDHDALRHINYVSEFHKLFELHSESARALCQRLRNAIVTKQPADFDTDEVLNVKTLIRKTEATAAAKAVGVPEEKLHFLDLPFYRTGKVSKRPIGEEDVALIASPLARASPGQIYVAGDLSDPHGTHRVCAQAILRALELVRPDGLQPEVWLYRGAWQEYEPHEIERAVPLSPEVMLRKKLAIFKHESQKDKALFPGHDEREFWVRAEERTRNTAQIYNDLGLPEYYALEGFARLSGQF